MPDTLSLTLTIESDLKRWVSGVWLKVEWQKQGCSCTRTHEEETIRHGNAALI